MARQEITPCLWFDSNAEEAAKFYTSIFPNSKIHEVVPYAVETPSNKPIGSVMSVSFELDGYSFLGLNGGPYFKPNPSISFHVKCKEKGDVDKIWKKLSERGTILMPLDKYPFSERYGWLQDKYGFSWQIIFVGDTEIKQRFIPILLFVKDVYGNAEEAVNLYTSIFKGSSIGSILRYEKGEQPDKEGTVKYAGFKLLGQDFGAMDSAHEHKFTFNEAVSLMISCSGQKEIDYYYSKFSSDTNAEMCGWLKDKFGVSWQLVTVGFEKLMTGKNAKKVMTELLKMKRINIKKLEEAHEGKN